LSLLGGARAKFERTVRHARDQRAARQEKAESDITPDAGIAGSRANVDGEDGSYVGRISPQFDADVRQSGAEARSERARLRDEGT
jgi:hypothetical protein